MFNYNVVAVQQGDSKSTSLTAFVDSAVPSQSIARTLQTVCMVLLYYHGRQLVCNLAVSRLFMFWVL